MKPGSKDKAYKILIAGPELEELKKHTWEMAESFGLDARIERYKGTRPIGLYRWDMDCLTDVSGNRRALYPGPDREGRIASKIFTSRRWS